MTRVQRQKIQQSKNSGLRSKQTVTNPRELRVSNLAIFKEKAKFSGIKAETNFLMSFAVQFQKVYRANLSLIWPNHKCNISAKISANQIMAIEIY